MPARPNLLIFVVCCAGAAHASVQFAECTTASGVCASRVLANDDFDSVELLQVQKGLVAHRQKASRHPLTAAGHAEQPPDGVHQEASSEANSVVQSVSGWISGIGQAVAAAVENSSVADNGSNGTGSEADADAARSIAGWISNVSTAIADAVNSTGTAAALDAFADAAQSPNWTQAVTNESVAVEGQVVVAGWISDAGEAVAAALQNVSVALQDGTDAQTDPSVSSIAGWMANVSRAVAGVAEIAGGKANDKDVADLDNVLGIENLADMLGSVSHTVASAVTDLQAQLEVAAREANKTMTIAAARLVMNMGSAKVDAADRLVSGLLAAKKEVADLLEQVDQGGDVEVLSAKLAPSVAVIDMLVLGAADLMGSSADDLRSSSTNSMAQREALVQRMSEPDAVARARDALRDADAAVVMTSAFASSMGSAVEDTQTLVEGLVSANNVNNWPREGVKELQDGLVAATLKISKFLTVDFVAEETARLSEEKQSGESSSSSLQTILLIAGSFSFVGFAIWIANSR